MSKKSRFRNKLNSLLHRKPGDPADEGKWEIKFTFDGKVYRKTHQFSEFETTHMKQLCAEFGDLAADQVIWRAAFRGIGIVAENVLAQAGKDYQAAHYSPKVVENAVQVRPASLEQSADIHVWPEDEEPSEAVDPPSPMNPDEA